VFQKRLLAGALNAHLSARTQKLKNSKTQELKNLKTQELKNSRTQKLKTKCQFMFLRQSFDKGSLTLRNFLATSQVAKRKQIFVSKYHYDKANIRRRKIHLT
jgi:hypothetical protein